ncbi:MAG: T9SS type B sorting domain-containing protein [Algibacter sp.]
MSNGTFGNGFDWHQVEDHTTNDTNGKCLIVNAATAPGEFYKTTISGLCETTTYEFSAWLINLVKVPGFCVNQGIAIPVNVSFEIWDGTDANLLASGNTGDINEAANPNWEEYGLVFQTLAGQSTVILKMINNGVGGCGNDLAIDDIEFKSCGDFVAVTDATNKGTVNLCSTETPYLTTLTATPDFSVYSGHFYQWQESTDGINWNDIARENNQSILVSISNSIYYRAKISEVAANLSNPLCVSFSNEYEAVINQLPAMPTLACWEMATINTITCSWDVIGTQDPQPTVINCWDDYQFDTLSCSWINNGSQDVQPVVVNCWDDYQFDTTSCTWINNGSQDPQPSAVNCWDDYQLDTMACTWGNIGVQDIQPNAVNCWDDYQFDTVSCSWINNGVAVLQPTAINCWDDYQLDAVTCTWVNVGVQDIQPIVVNCWDDYQFDTLSCSWINSGVQPGNITEETVELCSNRSLTLQTLTNIINPSYIWSTNETSDDIVVSTAGLYSVDITGDNCAFETRVFNVIQIEEPVIESVISDRNNIVITTSNSGDFLYSLDGNIFQSNNIFYNVEGGLYTVYVIEQNCNDIVNVEHLHFYIPKYFTPNNDGIHDRFNLSGIEYYGTSQVSIFNRYGKLLKYSRNASFSWDGTYNNENMPTDDYWYVVIIDDQKFMGNFTLKR